MAMLKIAARALLLTSVHGEELEAALAADTVCDSADCGLELLQLRAERVLEAPEDDLEDLCDLNHGINMHHSKVIHSNLGGAGPDEGDQTLIYANVSVVNGHSVNMVVTASDDYTPYNTKHNGVVAGSFGRINVQVNSSVILHFNFVEGDTGNPIEMPALYFTVFDLDQGMDYDSREKLILRGLVEYKLVNDTELKVENLAADAGVSFSSMLQGLQEQRRRKVEEHKLADDSADIGADVGVSFQSTQRGGKMGNPMNPFDLTGKQQRRAVMAKFPKGDGFSIEWNEIHFAGMQGRNLLFAGASSLGCKREGSCSSFSCPEGYSQRTMAEFLVCDHSPCNDEDRDTCCFKDA